MATMQKITSNLWFNHQAEAAVEFYTSVFNNSKRGRTSYYGKDGFDIHGMPEGTVMVMEFCIEGQWFSALNGGPHFKFNEAISFIVYCDSQQEVDDYWAKLTDGGDEKAQMCGWLKDQFGVSWQVVPTVLPDMVSDPDPDKSQRVMNAIMQMKKIDIAALEQAFGSDSTA